MIRRAETSEDFCLDGIRWTLHGSLRDLIFDEHGLRLSEWKEQGRATVVKQGSGRTIHHVRLPELELYVKHFRATNLASRLHQTLRMGRAQKEFSLARLLRDCGVPTIRPIALGEKRRGGLLVESYFLTEAISGGLTLYEFIERFVRTGRAECPPRLRFFLAREIARLAARIHEAGIEHRDLHERNLILQPQPDGPFRLYLLDLHELRVHGTLPWPLARRELARTGRYFTLRTSRTDRLRFLRHYAELRRVPVSQVDDLARTVEEATMESRADFWRRRDSRPRRKNPAFHEYRLPGVIAYASTELPERTVRQLMRNPDAPFGNAVRRWWKMGRVTRVAEVQFPSILRGRTLIYKQYHFKGWHESLAALVHPNQATRAWSCGAALLLREIPTPRPLLLLHKLRCGLPVNSYLLTQKVPGAVTIAQYLEEHLPRLEPAERKRVVRGVIECAAILLRTLHERRVTHRDLKASNILVSPAEDLAQPQLWLVDLDSVQTWQTVPERLRIQNLARFHVSFHQSGWITRADRLRFLRTYLGHHFLDRPHWKSYWRRVAVQTQRKVQRNRRRGRDVV